MSSMRVEQGQGLTLVPDLAPEVVQGEVVDTPQDTPGWRPEANTIEALREEMRAAVADIEWRLKQQYEIARRNDGGGMGQVFVEDIDDSKHRVTGYTVTANSPTAGHIAWASLHIVYMGVDWTIADGNTATGGPFKYIYFIKPGSGTTATLQMSNTFPTLGANDALIFVNNAGVPTSNLEASVTPAVAPGSIDNAALANGAVSSAKTDFYTTLSTAITTATTKADQAQATADGSIVTYFQPAAPWANGDATAGGATNPGAKLGDIWYDSDDGQAWRWSGPTGPPANQWVMIEDSNIGAALTAANNAQGTANTKITTFYANLGSIPTSLSIGDLWIVIDNQNAVRRASIVGANTLANWPLTQFGDGAISGIGGTKVGTGINGDNVTSGTVVAARVGAGVNGVILTTGTGTVGSAQVGSGAITPIKMNTAFHLLY